MGSPDWSRIPFEKMPQWKKDEILAHSKKVVGELDPLKCKICGKICKNKLGLASHLKSHNNK